MFDHFSLYFSFALITKMAKLALICLFLLCFCTFLNTLTNSNGTVPIAKPRIAGSFYTETYSKTVFRLDFPQGQCTGTFISQKAILTAAQCCEEDQWNQVVKIHDHKRHLKLDVRKYHINGNYYFFGMFRQDGSGIAIIEFNEPLDWVVTAEIDYRGVSCGHSVRMYSYCKADAANSHTLLHGCTSSEVHCGWFLWFMNFFINIEIIDTHAKDGHLCKVGPGGPMFNSDNQLVGVVSREDKYATLYHKKFIEETLYQIENPNCNRAMMNCINCGLFVAMCSLVLSHIFCRLLYL